MKIKAAGSESLQIIHQIILIIQINNRCIFMLKKTEDF